MDSKTRVAIGCIWLLMLTYTLSKSETTPEETLDVTSSHPSTNTFVLGEPITLTFSARGLKPNAGDLTLELSYLREDSERIGAQTIRVKADALGNWYGTVQAQTKKDSPLGYYRVEPRLSNGVRNAAKGTRPGGFITYAIVRDPTSRVDYGGSASRIGMQGGFSTSTNEILALLGVRWVCDSYDWGTFEKLRPGQFHDAEASALRAGRSFPPEIIEQTRPQYKGKPWRVYTLPTLIRNALPEWALDSKTTGTDNKWFGALSPDGAAHWPEYAAAAASAYARNHTSLDSHIFQLTWEPAYPQAFRGTASQLVDIYSMAYARMHEADPKAEIIGPTLFPGTEADDARGMVGPYTNNAAWINSLWSAGLGEYVDGFSIHPYWKFPPEQNGFIPALRAQIGIARLKARKMIPFYGTEHGYRSVDAQDELDQAYGNIRQILIMLGEGARFDFAFYAVDYSDGIGGFGYYYNLDAKHKFGANTISPKASAPALAALTSILDGSEPRGAIKGLGTNSVGYRFARAGRCIEVFWSSGGVRTEVTEISAPEVAVFDWMGNAKTARPVHGVLQLSLGPEPVYVEFLPSDGNNM